MKQTLLLLILAVTPAHADRLSGAAAGAGTAMSDIGRVMMQDALIRQRDQEEYQRQLELQRRQQEAQNRRSNEAELEKLERAHPGWRALVGTKKFSAWTARQPPSVQRLADSPRSDDAILMLDLYKQHLKEKP